MGASIGRKKKKGSQEKWESTIGTGIGKYVIWKKKSLYSILLEPVVLLSWAPNGCCTWFSSVNDIRDFWRLTENKRIMKLKIKPWEAQRNNSTKGVNKSLILHSEHYKEAIFHIFQSYIFNVFTHTSIFFTSFPTVFFFKWWVYAIFPHLYMACYFTAKTNNFTIKGFFCHWETIKYFELNQNSYDIQY